ncbi:MAG: outer membrane protein assembly factor BamD [Candidatus Omnitrophica bacterium]|nr:outer membrane protein assembly factor BamD [Candidatus Omnitrophota bacterium]
MLNLQNMFRRNFVLSLIFLIALPSLCRAVWIWTPETGKFINPKWDVKPTPEDQLEYAQSFKDQGNCKKAIAEFKKLIKAYPRAKEAPEAEFFTGQCLESMNKPFEAYQAYQLVIDKYPFSERAAQIVALEYNIANHLLENKGRSKWAEAVVGSDSRVIEIFRTVIKDAPYGKLAAISQYKIGLYLKEKGLYQEARDEFEKTMNDYPASEWAQAAKFQIAMADTSRASDAQHEQKVTSVAMEEFNEFVKNHPDSQLAPEAQAQMARLKAKEAENSFVIAQFYEKQKNLKAARIYYKEVTNNYADTSWGAKASAHLKVIGE